MPLIKHWKNNGTIFLLLLIILMASALGSGFPVAFALPGSAIVTIVLAGMAGYVFDGNMSAYFHSGKRMVNSGCQIWEFAEVERDTLIAIPLTIFMGIMLQKSKIAEDLLFTMAQLLGKFRGLGISVVLLGLSWQYNRDSWSNRGGHGFGIIAASKKKLFALVGNGHNCCIWNVGSNYHHHAYNTG